MKKILLLAALFAVFSCASNQEQGNDELGELGALEALGDNPVQSQWYKMDLDGAVCADGSKWLGAFKKGKENKVLFLFYGGGISTDAYTAKYGHASCESMAEMYYMSNLTSRDASLAITCLEGTIAAQRDDNPFKDWSFVVIPYSTGDFHCGTGDFEYVGNDGQAHVLCHHGFTNFEKVMDKVTPLLGNPEALVITGYSAGGFGTSILSDDLINRFPETGNVTVCVDASVLRKSDWHDVAANVWKAPEHICNRISGDFISLDCLKALHKDKPSVKILFGCSTYDMALTLFQTYFDTGVRRGNDRESLDIFHNNLKEFVAGFQSSIPEGGLFIWNDFIVDEALGSTQHTIEFTEKAYSDLGGHGCFLKWISDAVDGNVNVYGTELL